ncbi:MAG: hypothetical protein ACRDOI_43685 [Trebonia sp.]
MPATWSSTTSPSYASSAVDYQQALTGVEGIGLIPAQWLHPTMQGIGFTDELDAYELGHLDHALTAALAAVEPPAVEFHALTIQREADYLKAPPAAALYPCAARCMTSCCPSLAPSGSGRPSEFPAPRQHRLHHLRRRPGAHSSSAKQPHDEDCCYHGFVRQG